MSIFDVIRLRDFNSLRAFLYVLVPALIVALGVANAELWVGLAAAVLSPLLASANTVDGFRKWFYNALAAGQALVLGLNVLTEAQVSVWIPVIGAVVGGAVAASHVND